MAKLCESIAINMLICVIPQAWRAKGPSDHVRSLAGYLLHCMSHTCQTGMCVLNIYYAVLLSYQEGKGCFVHISLFEDKRTYNKSVLSYLQFFFLSGWVGLPCGLPVGPLFSDRERGDGDHGECQQAPSSECAATPRRLLLHRQNCSQPGKKKPQTLAGIQSKLLQLIFFPSVLDSHFDSQPSCCVLFSPYRMWKIVRYY